MRLFLLLLLVWIEIYVFVSFLKKLGSRDIVPMTQTRRKVILIVIVLVVAGCSVWVLNADGDTSHQKYRNLISNASLIRLDQPAAVTAHFMSLDMTQPLWMPGGVLGPSLEETVSELDSIFESIFHSGDSRNIRNAVCKSAAAAAATVKPQLQLLNLVRNVTTALLVQSVRREDDCVLHLVPHHRAICLIAAAFDDFSGTDPMTSSDDVIGGSNNSASFFLPMNHRRAFRETFCGRLLPCAHWARGRFRVNISRELLQNVMTHRVLPKIRRNRELFHLHQELFLHGEVADTALRNESSARHWIAVNLNELKWLKRRHKTQEVTVDRIRSHFKRKEEEMLEAMGYVEAKKSPVRREAKSSFLSDGTTPPIPILSLPTTDVFQGSIVFAVPPSAPAESSSSSTTTTTTTPFTTLRIARTSESEGVMQSRGQTADSTYGTFEYLTSVETLAVLHSLCCRLSSAAMSSTSVPCVLLMHGDSVMREFYDRLVIHIRYGFGMQSSSSSSSLSEWKFRALQFQVRSTEDFVYRVFATHDEVFRLSDTFSNDDALSPSNSLKSYVEALISVFKATACDVHHHSLPILHLIFVWDNKGEKPREGLYTPQVFGSAHVHVPLQVHGLNFWSSAIHHQMLSSLWKLAKSTSTTTSKRKRNAEVVNDNQGRLLYIMTPPHQQPRGTVFTPTKTNKSVVLTTTRNVTTAWELEKECPLVPDACLGEVETHWAPSRQIIRQWRLDRGGGGSSSTFTASALRSRIINDNSSQNCFHPSITKSLQWLLWLNDTIAERQVKQQKQHSSHAAAALNRNFVVQSVAVLDKGKGQFAGFTLSDHLHFGCRCQIIRSRSRYMSSFFPPTLRRLLSQRWRGDQHDDNVRGDASSSLCGGTISAQAFSTLLHSTLKSAIRLFWEALIDHIKRADSLNGNVSVSSPHFGRRIRRTATPHAAADDATRYENTFFSVVERPIALKPDGVASGHHHFSIMPSSPPKSFMFLEWVSDECRSSGDLYLLQLLLYDAVLKVQKRV